MLVKAVWVWALAALLAGASSGCRAAPDGLQASAPERLGLMTSLPLYWPEAHDVGELLQNREQTGQARQALERRYVLEPLDTLEAEVLRDYDRLLLAQPRALSPGENVALDQWVRDGGRLLLFADPMLTHHSHYGIGDKRRAQDVILLSPILARWGLELTFDPEQPAGERQADVDGIAVPVSQSGAFALQPGGSCEIAGAGILARCRIGRGTVTILADAAVLDEASKEDEQSRQVAIERLARLAFD
jgi:hypothetical protein